MEGAGQQQLRAQAGLWKGATQALLLLLLACHRLTCPALTWPRPRASTQPAQVRAAALSCQLHHQPRGQDRHSGWQAALR